VGMGERKTPKPFIAACNQFKYLDVLYTDPQKINKVDVGIPEPVKPFPLPSPKDEFLDGQTHLDAIRKTLLALVEEGSDEDGWLFIGDVGNQLAKRFPDFDVRNFGYKKLTPFIKSLKLFEIRAVPAGEGRNIKLIYIRIKV